MRGAVNGIPRKNLNKSNLEGTLKEIKFLLVEEQKERKHHILDPFGIKVRSERGMPFVFQTTGRRGDINENLAGNIIKFLLHHIDRLPLKQERRE